MYDEDVYLLDLCILSYHLHAQTLIWPFDPYYEFSKNASRRLQFMDAMRSAYEGMSQFHGPASCQGTGNDGWQTNATLEPILSDYTRIYPWRPCFTRPDGEAEPWIVYDTPSEITDRIGKVHMVCYSAKAGPYHAKPEFEVSLISSGKPGSATKQLDDLYCFEGGTGAVYREKSQQQYPAWSLMGFVLARTLTDVELKVGTPDPQSPQPVAYDIYIVFRGSRSGQLRPKEALWSKQGNPDWVTDLQFTSHVSEPEICYEGRCAKGFAASLQSMLPTVMKALQHVHADKGQKAPRHIFVTGHSLGGALASLFTSAVLLGASFRPYGRGDGMAPELRLWPWRTMRYVTYSSPTVGNSKFRRSLSNCSPGKQISVGGDIVAKELRGEVAGIALELAKKESIIGKLNPHEPIAVRRALLWRLSQIESAKKDLAQIPMQTADNEPWKFFSYADSMLTSLAKNRRPADLAALFPNCEVFLLHFLSILSSLGKANEASATTATSTTASTSSSSSSNQLGAEGETLSLIATEIQRLNSIGSQPFDKLRSLCKTWQNGKENARAKGKNLRVYYLIGPCLFCNALSSDPSIMNLDSAKFATIKALIEPYQGLELPIGVFERV